MHRDEQHDLSLPGTSQRKRPTTPDSQGEARLIQDLQAMYDREKSVSLERVWTRLVHERTSTNATVPTHQPPATPGSLKQRRFSERNAKMQPNHTVLPAQKGLPRFLTLLAAALVSIVLVGSLLLILTLTKSAPWTTKVGSLPMGSTSTATATPLTSPECLDTNDLAEQQLCLTHKETILNLPKTFGTHKVIFRRAYADMTQLILVYTTADPPTSDVISFESVNIQQGITLTGGSSTSYQNPQTHETYYVVSFATQNVPAGTTQIHVQSIVDGFSGKATPLEVTIPFNTNQKTIAVNKTVTSKGISLTLERLVIAGSETLIYCKPSQPLNNGLYVAAISFNGQPFNYTGGQTDSMGSSDVVIHFNAIVDKPGSWTLKISDGVVASPGIWTFTFMVPAN